MEIKFSIIVPIYKVEKFLRKCIESVLNQSYSNFELLLIDDGSPDNCPLICDEYENKDCRVKVVHKSNGGLVSARNTGVFLANGEYICYVDGDDWVQEDWLQSMYEITNKNNPDIVVFGAIKKYSDKEEVIPLNINEGFYNKEALVKHIYPYMMYDKRQVFCKGLIFPVAWNKIYKADLLKNHYCKETKIRMGEDNAFIFEICYFANSVYFTKDIFYIYNQLNINSITSNYDSNRFSNNKMLIEYIEANLYGKEDYLDEQINAFKAYWLIMAVFHEVKCNIPLLSSRKHIAKEIKKNKSLNNIKLKGLPILPKIYIILLKCRLYLLILIFTKIVNKAR